MTRPWPGFGQRPDCKCKYAKQSTVLEILQEVRSLHSRLNHLSAQMGTLMTQDASILAVAQGIEANDQNLAAALVTIQTAVATLLQEVAAGGTTAISDSTMAALTAAKTDFDAALATAEQNASDDTTATTPPAPAS
jgi:hypothetical protein